MTINKPKTKSSSFHRLSADVLFDGKKNFISILHKILVLFVHFPLSWINNSSPNKNVDKNLKIKKFTVDNLDLQLNKIDPMASPSRKICNLFWLNVDWAEMEKELEQINICDLGCGSGEYYNKIQDYSGNKIHKYCGFDIYEDKNWSKIQSENKNIIFKKYNGTDILEKIPKDTNVIISQSALEHFSEDITVLRQIKTFVQSSQQVIYQIHLVPAVASLPLYPFHGVRQYSARTISKITQLFSDSSEVTLFKLGGQEGNKVHIKYIRGGIFPFFKNKYFREKILPFFKKKKNKLEDTDYSKVCANAIQKDFNSKNSDFPPFYALTIKTPK